MVALWAEEATLGHYGPLSSPFGSCNLWVQLCLPKDQDVEIASARLQGPQCALMAVGS